MTENFILHEDPISGHCYKIKLTAALLQLPLERRTYSIIKGETRSPEFLETINPNGRVPVLQFGKRSLTQSNACCLWLAHGSKLIPEDHFAYITMMQWLFFEQNEHEPNIATPRYWRKFLGAENMDAAQHAALPGKYALGLSALQVMNDHLTHNHFFIGRVISLADIALYAYTHIAGDGGFDLSCYPAIERWMDNIAATPGYIGMDC
jgi:glutathione S-transferase